MRRESAVARPRRRVVIELDIAGLGESFGLVLKTNICKLFFKNTFIQCNELIDDKLTHRETEKQQHNTQSLKLN